MNFVTIEESFIRNSRRIVKFLRLGSKDVQTSYQAGPQGIDSAPRKGKRAIYAATQKQGETVILGYINEHGAVEDGEIKIYSEDSDGAIAIYAHFKQDGTIEFNGSTDNLVTHAKLKEVIVELQQDINNLKQLITSWAPVANDGGAALKAALATWQGTQLTEDIDQAKAENLKTS
jgi:hypothetical protein